MAFTRRSLLDLLGVRFLEREPVCSGQSGCKCQWPGGVLWTFIRTKEC